MVAGFVALATVSGAGNMAAQTPAAKDSGEGAFTAEEAEALQLARDEKLLTARTKAEEILKRDPASIVGHYVMGSVLREAEGRARAVARSPAARA